MTDIFLVAAGGFAGAIAIRYGSVRWLRATLLPGIQADWRTCAIELRGAIRAVADAAPHHSRR